MRRIRLLVVLAVVVLSMLAMTSRAWSCTTPCPRGQNCIQMCFPEIF